MTRSTACCIGLGGDARRLRLKTRARLRRVNRQLAAWDEFDAMELMPNSLRPRVEQPRLDREQLKSLQRMLVDALPASELAAGDAHLRADLLVAQPVSGNQSQRSASCGQFSSTQPGL
jgi:hypothetical protein